jgi:transposase-like protein
MPRERDSQPARARGGKYKSDEVPTALSALAERFARFRASHQRGARVPPELRAAALAVLRQGVTEGALRRNCGIAWSQLDVWKKCATGRSRSSPSPAEAVRVFSVVDDARPGGPRAVAAEQTLELRAGPWSVTVRFAGPEPAPGGR